MARAPRSPKRTSIPESLAEATFGSPCQLQSDAAPTERPHRGVIPRPVRRCIVRSRAPRGAGVHDANGFVGVQPVPGGEFRIMEWLRVSIEPAPSVRTRALRGQVEPTVVTYALEAHRVRVRREAPAAPQPPMSDCGETPRGAPARLPLPTRRLPGEQPTSPFPSQPPYEWAVTLRRSKTWISARPVRPCSASATRPAGRRSTANSAPASGSGMKTSYRHARRYLGGA